MAKEEKPGQPTLEVNTGDEQSRGRYSNNVIIVHSPEEFIIDWLLGSHSGTHLVARTIVSPGHFKRLIAAMEENLANYESKFGPVKAIEPTDRVFH